MEWSKFGMNVGYGLNFIQIKEEVSRHYLSAATMLLAPRSVPGGLLRHSFSGTLREAYPNPDIGASVFEFPCSFFFLS